MNILIENEVLNIPIEMRNQCSTFVLWRNLDGRKVPVDWLGGKRGNDSNDLHMTFEQATETRLKHKGAQLGLYLPKDGLQLTVDGNTGWLHVIDLDGFLCDGQWGSGSETVWKILAQSYCEVSPSGTGMKIFVVSDAPPSGKAKYPFAPSEFYAVHPEVRKYGDSHGVEWFTQGFYVALTGLDPRGTLKFVPATHIETLHGFLESKSINPTAAEANTQGERVSNDFAKLTPEALIGVLSCISNYDEQNWSDVTNALARAYREAGREYFVQWSEHGYKQDIYDRFSAGQCNTRFDRALRETDGKDGYGCKHLCKMAGIDATDCEWEDTPVPNIYNQFSKGFRELFPTLFEPALETPTPSKPQRYTFRTASDLASLPPMTWRVKKALPDIGLAAIFGPSGSGKSFLAIDLLARISLGLDFYGRKTSACPVVYVCLEGSGGIVNRIAAWEKYNQRKLPDTFRMMTEQFSLFEQDARGFAMAITEAGLDAGVIVIDTLNQSAPTADENTSSDMGRILQNAKTLQQLTGSLVILVHHSGKDASKGLRGHSSLLAALDASIEVKRTAAGREWALSKAKDADDSGSYAFKLEVVPLGVDSDQEQINSCVAVSDMNRAFQLPPPKGKNQLAALNALKAHAAKNDSQRFSAADIAACVKAALGGETKQNATRTKEAVNGLLAGGYLEQNGDTLILK